MIYVVEDDASIRELVVYTFNGSGLESRGFEKPSEFFAAVKEQLPKLVLLDLMLPEQDGMSILAKLRADPVTKDIPVMIVSAKDSEFDKIKGLDNGADDYVTKPFGMMELVSRVKVQLRHIQNNNKANNNEDLLKVDELCMDCRLHKITIRAEEIALTLKEFELLCLLLRHPEQVFTREQLLDKVWGIDCYIESRTVDVHIRTLRVKLGDYGYLVETVRGVGYRLGKKD
jgi:two-component system, OmpR family, alkaline phosphatase synthesis response regulator PhoP